MAALGAPTSLFTPPRPYARARPYWPALGTDDGVDTFDCGRITFETGVVAGRRRQRLRTAAASPRVLLFWRFRLFGFFDHIRNVVLRERFELFKSGSGRFFLARAFAK